MERGGGELKSLPGVATCHPNSLDSPIKVGIHERMQKKKLHGTITTELYIHDL